jgi:hypothetical protein
MCQIITEKEGIYIKEYEIVIVKINGIFNMDVKTGFNIRQNRRGDS